MYYLWSWAPFWKRQSGVWRCWTPCWGFHRPAVRRAFHHHHHHHCCCCFRGGTCKDSLASQHLFHGCWAEDCPSGWSSAPPWSAGGRPSHRRPPGFVKTPLWTSPPQRQVHPSWDHQLVRGACEADGRWRSQSGCLEVKGCWWEGGRWMDLPLCCSSPSEARTSQSPSLPSCCPGSSLCHQFGLCFYSDPPGKHTMGLSQIW